MVSFPADILVIDDQADSDDALPATLRQLGHHVAQVRTLRQGMERLTASAPDLVFLTLDSPDPWWNEKLREMVRLAPDTAIITFGKKPTVHLVCQSYRLGAFDCLLLPLDRENRLIQQAIRQGCRETERRRQQRRGGACQGTTLADANQQIRQLEKGLLALQEELDRERDKRLSAENSAREIRKTFQIMFQNTHDAILHLDRTGHVLNANGTLMDIFGLRPEEIIGTDLSEYDFLGPDYMQAMELYKAALPDISFPPFELEVFQRDGTRVHIESQAKLILNNGVIEGIINIIRNITPQKRLEKAKNATILGLAKLAESRDDSTGQHLERVREYVKIITEALSGLTKYEDYITADYVKDIYLSAILHDIGKVSVPDTILLKPGALTEEEFEIIKRHTIVGGNALAAIDAQLEEQSFLKLGKEIAYYHHESWDGCGYPQGLMGEEIPLSARIVALADVYDALTTERVYKAAFPHDKAVEIILAERGRKFDPEIVDVFAANQHEFDRIRKKINVDLSAPKDKTPARSATGYQYVS